MAFPSTPRDAQNIPIGCVYVPNVGFVALQGATPFSDGSGNQSAPAMFSGPILTSATSVLTTVGASATSVVILAANASRKGMYLYNDSSSAMYLAFAATASTTAFTVKIPAGNFFEMPTQPVYTSTISAVWDSATGNARITELT